MTELQSLIDQAKRVETLIICPDCDFEEAFSEFLQRDERVDEDDEMVDFGCPACGSDTVDLGQRRENHTAFVVEGLEELEQLAGE